MKQPKEYVDLLNEFVKADIKAARIDDATRDDLLCLRMAAFVMELPVEVLNGKDKNIFLRKRLQV